MEEAKGWHSRGYLPHFDGGDTIHLGDALPRPVVNRWKLELEHERKEETRQELSRRIEKYLDRGIGACYLRKTAVGIMVQDALLHFDGERYKLISWVIMPNHVHMLIKVSAGQRLSDIMRSVKSFTAHEANKILQRSGRFWQEDYFDRYIRNYEHFENTVNYIEMNPVRAGLCDRKRDWELGSARRLN